MAHNVIIKGFKAVGKIIGRGFGLYTPFGIKVRICSTKDKPYTNQKLRTDGMHHVIGSAVTLFSEVDHKDGTVVTLQSLFDPNGDEVLSNQVMSWDTVNPSVALKVWQSLKGTHELGRYRYLIKAVNGIYTNVSKAYFYIDEED
jgi:hypothetical protein